MVWFDLLKGWARTHRGRLRVNSTAAGKEFIAPKRFESVASECNNSWNRPYRCVSCDLPPAPSQQSRRSFLGKFIPRQKLYELFGLPTFLSKRLDGVGGHHQIIAAPRHSIALLSDRAGQEQALISQRSINFVAKDGGTNVYQIDATCARPLSPLNPKQIVRERLDTRHPGKRKPAINDVIHAH
jgi:hypothetical protein